MQDYVNIMEFLMKHWNIAGLVGLNSEAQKAQEDVQALLTKFRRLTDRQVSSLLQNMCTVDALTWSGCRVLRR